MKRIHLYYKDLGSSVVVSYNKNFNVIIEFCSYGSLAEHIVALENSEDVIIVSHYVKA